MIISFLNHNKNAHSVLNLVYKDDRAKYKQPLYYKTSQQLIQYRKELKGIIIPGIINESIDYAPDELVKHIRIFNDSKISTLPIVITNADKIIDDFEPFLLEGLEIFSNEIDVSFDGLKKLTEDELNNITVHLGNQNDDISRHEISNQWGAYRLIRQIDLLDSNNHSPFVEKIHTDISESLFFRKLLFRELEDENIEIAKNDKVTFKSRLKKLRSSINKLAIIDDEIDKWGDAYKALFHNVEINSFNQTKTKFHTENSKQYDLIILDLRIEEDAHGDERDQLTIDNLSGIKLLEEIKKADPTVPVIMCTASNKSWSQDAALKRGADGFWTKESPSISLGWDYSFHNTFDLINVCIYAINWSNSVKPIFLILDSIRAILNKIDYSIEDSFNLKYNLIATSLLKRPNEFLGKRFKSSLVFPFLTIWSIRNDILSAVTNRKVEGDIEEIFCEFKGSTVLMFYKENGLYFIDKDFKKLIKGNPRPNHRYDETSIINYLLLNTFGRDYNKKRRELKKLQKIRNHIDIIHGYTQSKIRVTSDEIKLNDLYDLLDIYYEIIKSL